MMGGIVPGSDVAVVSHSITIAASVDEVWSVVRDVGAIGAWLPGVGSSWLEYGVRVVEYSDGSRAREQILDIDDTRRTYTYKLLAGRLPLNSYEARFWVHEVATGAAVDWTGAFVPRYPSDVVGISDTLHRFYRSGLEELGRLLARADVEET